MKEPVKNIDLEQRVFAARPADFTPLAIEIFRFQYEHNEVYRKYCDLLKIRMQTVDQLHKIPFLPIAFFKSHKVVTTTFDAEAVFESSATTGSARSRHFVKELGIYRESFLRCFEKFYGPPAAKCILALLPSYVEQGNSSLVYMVDELVKRSSHSLCGFYHGDHKKLYKALMHNEIKKQPTLLIGVTYALLDFADRYRLNLRNTIVMETGGMKGRRVELTRPEIHRQLQEKLGVPLVHSEYGMTELLSQSYSKGDGIFHSPSWKRILLRGEDDPLQILMNNKERTVNGVINIIDLANIYSCSFIATDDIGRLHPNGSFEILGRLDRSDVRGCSLLTAQYF